MFRICRIGCIFLKKSKSLTCSAFLCVFVACFLSISMFQLASNVEHSFEAEMEAKKGNFDVRVAKGEGICFNQEELRSFETDRDTKKVTGGYQTNELFQAYLVGVKDDEINRSLYKYTKSVRGNDIVINDTLARREDKEVGDILEVSGTGFHIAEVIKTTPRSDYRMPMIVMDLQKLHQLLGDGNTDSVNYLLIQCKPSAFETVSYGGGVINHMLNRISSEQYDVIDERQGGEYDQFVTTVRMIFRIFFVVIVLVSGLFVVNIFLEYMRKYRTDMAVIRTFGGTQRQVTGLFCAMSMMVSAAACLAGAVISAVVSGVTLNWFNARVQMFEGNATLDWKVLCLIPVVVFVLLNLFVYLVFEHGQSVLPIQVFQETSTGLRKRKRANRFLFLRNVLGTEGYLAAKFMALKFRQNVLIILIIALITMLSYTGQTTLKLLAANDRWYNYHSLEGKDARAELTSNHSMSLEYAQKIYKMCQPVLKDGYFLFGEYIMTWGSGQTQEGELDVTNLDSLPTLLQTDVWDHYQDVPRKQRMVMEQSVAAEQGYHLGDRVTINSDALGGSREYVLVETIKSDSVWAKRCDVIVDWSTLSQRDVSPEGGSVIDLWANGQQEQLRNLFDQLQVEPGVELDYTIYGELVEQSDHILRQWTLTLHIVLGMLLFVAGIGLWNSARGMLHARQKDFHVFRMLGSSRQRISRICMLQVWIYMFSGVILGAVGGYAIVHKIWENGVTTQMPLGVEWGYLAGIVCYLAGLSVLLIPTIRRVRES